MDFDPSELDSLSREDLILRARARGVERPEQMTRIELRDEIVRLSEPDLERQRRSRGWLGVARDLLASVVESGLNLPDAAAAIRGDAKTDIDSQGPPPVATVTLAEIYAAQGHYDQALRMLSEVIAREPEHAAATALQVRLENEREHSATPRRRRAEPSKLSAEAGQEKAPSPPPPETPLPAAVAQAEAQPEEAKPAPAPAPAPAPSVELPSVSASHPGSAEPAPQVLILRQGDRVFVYWRVLAVSSALRLRSVTVCPAALDPLVVEQDHELPVAVGGFWLPRLPVGAEVRAAVGELLSDGFAPLAVAQVVGTGIDESYDEHPPDVEPGFEQAARAAASG